MTSDLKSIYTEILKKNGIDEEILEIEISAPKELVGEHQGSKCDYVTITFKDPTKEKLELFVKQPITTNQPGQSEMFAMIMMKEATFLTKFLSDMEQLCKSKLGFDTTLMDGIFPKTLHAGPDLLVLENLTVQGFRMIDKSIRQDLHQAKLVMGSLAKLHSISRILVQDEGGSREAYLQKYPTMADVMLSEAAVQIISPMAESHFKFISKVFQASGAEGAEEVVKFLSPYIGHVVEHIQKNLTEEGLFLCVNHGDCWNNNMLFSENMDRVTLVDLQVNRVASPFTDIAHYLFTSTKLEVLEQWKDLIQFYYDEFRLISLKLDHPIEYTLEEFLQEFAIKAEGGLIFGVVMTVAILGMRDQHADGSFFDVNQLEPVLISLEANQEKITELVEYILKLITIFKGMK